MKLIELSTTFALIVKSGYDPFDDKSFSEFILNSGLKMNRFITTGIIKNMNKKNILIIGAHPDDEILGCGGTIDKYKKMNYNIYSLILGSGIDSRDIKKKNDIEKKKLLLQSVKANKFLGVKEIYFENLKDNNFDSYSLLHIIKIIERYINKIKPIIIFTHNNCDLNIDHRITFQSTLTACRPQRNSSVKKLYSFEVPSSTEWAFSKLQEIFNQIFL